MDALNTIIQDAELHPRGFDETWDRNDVRVIVGFQQDVKKASFFITVNNAKKELTLGRSEPVGYETREFDKFTLLCFGFPLYCLGMTGKLENGWTCRVERTWGWGFPINLLHHYAVDFIDKWTTMSESEFRCELESRTAANRELCDHKEETTAIINAIINVLYKFPKEDISYKIRKGPFDA